MHSLTLSLYFLFSVSLALHLPIDKLSGRGVEGRFEYWEYPTKLAVPCDVTNGPDGAVYIQGLFSNSIVRLDANTRKITGEYFIPFTTPKLNQSLPTLPGVSPKPEFSCALVTGFDGYLYASNGDRNQLVQFNVTSKTFRIFTAPDIAGDLQPLNDVTAAPDGIYFTQTTGNVISKFDYKSHSITNFKIPTPASDPIGIYYASDGGIWFLETAAQKYGRFDRTSHNIVEYNLPPSLYAPLTMRAETNGRYIWFAASVGGDIGRIDIKTGAVKPFSVKPILSTPVELCPAKGDASTLPKNWAPGDSDIWFSHIAMNSLGRLSSATGEVKEVAYPDNLLPKSPVGLHVDLGSGIFCSPGNAIWFTQGFKNLIVRYQLG